MVGQRKYLDWCLHFPNRYFFIEMNNVLKQIPGLVKGAVVQMDSMSIDPTPSSNSNESTPEDQTPPVDETNTTEARNMMEELNAFVGDGMKNIELKIPFEEEIKTPKSDPPTENKFIKAFNGDIKNFENTIMRCSEKGNIIRRLESEFNECYAEMDCFPNITSSEMKSILYLSGRQYYLYNDQANKGPVKRLFGINKYFGVKHAKPINFELAYDLLVGYIFYQLCREKIENKTTDNYLNKTFLHITMGMHLAPFIFSFITSETELETIVRDRFRLMDKSGMFDSIKNNEFKTYGFDITERDMVTAVEDIRKIISLNDLDKLDSYLKHVSLSSGAHCVLNYDNEFNEEQIINMIIPMEINILIQDKKTDDYAAISDIVEQFNITDQDVLELFIKTTPKKNIPIVKFFEEHLTEIPENNRKDFMKNLESYNNRDYDLNDEKFPYDSFGEDGVKALYLWKPETGVKYNTYKKFYKAIVSSAHDKQTILSMITQQDTKEASGESFADFYTNAIGKGK